MSMCIYIYIYYTYTLHIYICMIVLISDCASKLHVTNFQNVSTQSLRATGFQLQRLGKITVGITVGITSM